MLAGFVEDYQARTNAALQLVDSARLPATTRNKARFAMQLMCDAFSPSNIPWLNPGVLKEATDTGGLSLLHGLQNFMDDMANNGGYPQAGRSFRLRTWNASGRDARPHRHAQRAHRADRLRSADAARACDSAALQPAVDQQVLHHGSGAGALVRRVGGAQRPPDLHDFVPQSRRSYVALHDGALSARRASRRHRRRSGNHRRAAS